MDSVSYLNPAQLHSNPAFTQAVRVPAGHDLMVISGQNGVDTAGRSSRATSLGKLDKRCSICRPA